MFIFHVSLHLDQFVVVSFGLWMSIWYDYYFDFSSVLRFPDVYSHQLHLWVRLSWWGVCVTASLPPLRLNLSTPLTTPRLQVMACFTCDEEEKRHLRGSEIFSQTFIESTFVFKTVSSTQTLSFSFDTSGLQTPGTTWICHTICSLGTFWFLGLTRVLCTDTSRLQLSTYFGCCGIYISFQGGRIRC